LSIFSEIACRDLGIEKVGVFDAVLADTLAAIDRSFSERENRQCEIYESLPPAVLDPGSFDCTGLATGGNKTRKLEFLVADAIAQGADTLVTQGATQSNHVRQTAAAACRVGMQCHALLERRVTNRDESYETTGNVLLDGLMGCDYAFRPEGLDMNAEAAALGEALRAQGRKPYVIPGGGSRALLSDEPLMSWLGESADDAEVILTVCTGTFALAKLGLLDGLEVTTHHSAIDTLKAKAPEAKVHENTRFVDNGKIVTTAGVSAGIDGALHVVSRLLGEEAAAKTARYMEYDKWEPEQGTIVERAGND